MDFFFSMLKPGDRFPPFSLENQDGHIRTLGDYLGQWLIVYVYPKDDTPGCTLQGQGFTARKTEFTRLGVHVVGLSEDGVESHQSFCGKYGFTIELLADPNHRLLNATGVGQSEWNGTLYWNRTSFLIDPTGVVRKVYEKVTPQGHEDVLLRDLASFQKS